MTNPKFEEAFNKQLNAEFESSYLYLSMAAYFESQSLRGMAHWMRVQAREEHAHMMKFFDFILERGGKVVLTQIAAPKTEWSSPLAAFEDAHKHECMISGRINDLVELATKERDHAANAFLQWFVTEQVEEEASVLEIVDQLKLVGEHGGGLFMVDRELSQRSVGDPTAG
jgi:ferritin